MKNDVGSGHTNIKSTSHHFLKSTRHNIKFIASFVTQDATKTAMQHDTNPEYNDSDVASRSISTQTQYNRIFFSKSDSFTDIAGDKSARHNEKCRKIDNLHQNRLTCST